MISPNLRYFYVNIPKNSSSYIKAQLEENGWEYANYFDINVSRSKFLIALRDPIARWFSGASEYLMMYNHEGLRSLRFYSEPIGYYALYGQTMAISMLFDRVTFDDHTERQAMFLQGVDLNRSVFIDINSQFTERFDKFLTDNGYHKRVNAVANETDKDGDAFARSKYKIKEVLTTVYDSNEAYQNQLAEWFKCDYELRRIAGLDSKHNTE